MPTTHAHDSSLILPSSLLTTHNYDFLPPSSHMCQLALAQSEPSHSSPVSYWFTLVLWKSQWKLMGWLPYSILFLYNPTFLQATCSICCLLHAGFLLGLLFSSEDRGDMFFQNNSYLSTDYMALYHRWQNYS
jgi:hypothetical protein